MLPLLIASLLLAPQDLPNEARLRKQRDTWLEIAQHRPQDVEAWHKVAEAERELKNWDAAIAAEGKAIEGHGKYAVAYAGRARAWFEKKDYGACRRDCNTVIELMEKGRGRRYYVDTERPRDFHLEAYRLRGLAFAWERRWSEALADYDALLELAPSRTDAHEERAHLALKAGRNDLAVQSLFRAGLLRLDAGDRRGAEAAVKRLEELGAKREAGELQKRLASAAPKSDLP